MSEEGFLRLSRRAFQHFLWKEPREKSRWEAWVDLIQSAAYAPETVLVQGRRLSLARGELVASVRYLAVRWNWDKNRVSRFIELLRDETMIETRIETGVSVVKLCRYDYYNPAKDKVGTPIETPARTDTGQTRDTHGTNPRSKEGEENSHSPALEPDGPSGRPGEEPTLARFTAECARYSIPAWYAERKHADFSTKGWKSGATPIVWRTAVRNWVVRDYENDGKPLRPPAAQQQQHGSKKHQPPHELTTPPNNGF